MKHLLLFVLIFAFVACGADRKDSKQAPPGDKTAQNSQSALVVKSIDEPALDRLIGERVGKALLLNVWATWCVPCKEEFPDLVRLAEAYRDRNVEIVGLSVDYPDEVESRIKPFLQAQKVNFDVYVADFEDQDQAINKLNPDWSGALPATFVFDTNGNQKVFLQGKQTYQEFQKRIEQQL